MMKEVFIDGDHLTLDQIEAVARANARVALAPGAFDRIEKSRAVIEEILAKHKTVYGVNTGFGKLSDITIGDDRVNELQLNLIRSHSAGVGEPYSIPVTRAIMLLRANVLAKGNSGVRREIIDLLLNMLNHNVHPVIPSKGSVGASGDLAPLAHLALVLVGEGSVLSGTQVVSGQEALRQKGLTPVNLEAKEGLALINGTQAMTGVGSLAWHTSMRLIRAADIAGAMSLDVLRGTDTAFDERIVNVRPHPGAVQVARNLRDLLKGSGIRESHRDSAHKVQDQYSLRCMPQVHGSVRDTLRVAEDWISIEINGATDNPLVFPEDKVLLSGGNFHGGPMSLCFDFLAIAVSQIASISERRVALLMDSSQSELAPFLSKQSGLHSGFMMAQVTAAALVSENKILAHPASADTIPTSANKEDHVSMGVTAALKFQQIVQNTSHVLAIELMCAAQALDLLAPLKSSESLQEAHRLVRSRVPMLEEDRVLSTDIQSLTKMVQENELTAEVERILGHRL
jgi:histidine ammonia-lyase